VIRDAQAANIDAEREEESVRGLCESFSTEKEPQFLRCLSSHAILIVVDVTPPIKKVHVYVGPSE
jgi:hypothetical protein